MRAPRRPRATVGHEQLLLVAGVGLASLVGFGTLGDAFTSAIHGDADSRAPIAISAEAGLGRALRSVADSGASVLQRKLRRLPAITNVESVKRTREMLPRERWGRARRVNRPDHLHEAPQALLYGERHGGGTYMFPSNSSQEGIDGYFLPHHLKATDGVQVLVDGVMARGHAVSLKDFSFSNTPVSVVFSKILKNAFSVDRAGFGGHTHLYTGLPQLAAHEIVRAVQEGGLFELELALAGATKAGVGAFQSVLFEAADGPVRFFAKDGQVMVRRARGKAVPVETYRPAAVAARAARLSPPKRLILWGGARIDSPLPGDGDVSVHLAEGVNPDALAYAGGLPFKDGAFETVRFERTPYYVVQDNDFASLAEAHRVLAPGGFLDLRAGPRTLWTKAEARLRELGFTDIKTVHNSDGARTAFRAKK